MNMIRSFFTKNWMHLAALGLCVIITISYFSLQLKGYGLKQHDIEQHKGGSHEIVDYRERTGKETLWTNSMFGGMPTMQISLLYEGNFINTAVVDFVKTFPPPAGVVLLYLFGFYIFALCLRINPWIGLFGAIAFAFATYNIIIIQAGHNSKALAEAFMAPVVGSFIMAYRHNLKWGIVLSALFMTIQLSMNHLQVSYYLLILLFGLGLVLFFEAGFVQKKMKTALLASVGIITAYLLAGAINYGNITLTNDYAKYSIRGGNDVKLKPDGTSDAQNATTGLDKDYVTEYSNGINESFTLISPYVKGSAPGAIGNTHFSEKLDEMDFPINEINDLKTGAASYWGDQPIVSGPSYLGIVLVFMALLALVLFPNPMNIMLFLVSLLALALSWGKNFMGLTDFFLDYIPGYNKFRAPTIIIVVVQLCMAMMAVFFLDKLVRERETLVKYKKKFLIASAAFLVILIGINVAGIDDSYLSANEKQQLDGYAVNVRKQILGMDPAQLMQQYQLDVTNEAQLQSFIDQQVIPVQKRFENLTVLREEIFKDSMKRSILFLLVAIGILALFFYSKARKEYILIPLILIMSIDLIAVDRNYLGSQEEGNGYRYWDLASNTLYPISATTADLQIMDIETSLDPKLKEKVDLAAKSGMDKATELGFTDLARTRVIDAYRFSALNKNTNYRVFDMNGPFNSAHASYFHKSLGGYHGAKLRNIQNVFEYHLAKSNNKVFNILNVKYFFKDGQAEPNLDAMGIGWFVKEIETYDTADDEIKALGNRFDMKNIGQGTLLVNGVPKTKAAAYGSESLSYVLNGDTLNVPLSNELKKDFEVYYVLDANGKDMLVPKMTLDNDTARSFLKLVEYHVSNEFAPLQEAIMLKEQAAGLKAKKFSGEGKITMTNYEPNEIAYSVEAKGNQFAVFSEIYYQEGWKATIDGKEVPIKKADYLLRGLEIPSGKHKVVFSFDLPKYHSSGKIALLGSLLIVLSIVALLYVDFRKKKVSEV